ncbi:hypothetical protein OH805_02205 [Streptomyces sp. NBC_00879]|uniref:hypothetical protein n=1 Tax=Streptomyces sp. NBC_00879 TaxID=2975855 RepID=UPI00386D1CFF|nr:hypothetical protein OH805_02205 [Streptomyces sp. NBC_00879]
MTTDSARSDSTTTDGMTTDGMTTDPVTTAFLRESADPHSPLHTVLKEISLPPALAAAAGTRLLSRPLFAPQQAVDRAAADTAGIFELITSLPQRLFDGDLGAYCRALGIDERTQKLITRLGGGAPPMYGRTDMSFDGSRFRLLEFNIASELGGIDRAGTLPRLWAQAPGFTSFAAEHALTYLDTGRLVAETLRAAARPVAGGRTPVVALLEAPGGLAKFGAVWEAVAELMRAEGLDFRVGEVHAVRSRGKRITLDGTAVDLVLRCFCAEEILAEPDGEAMVEPLFQAHEQGTVVLWTPLESYLFSNKGALALLSRPRLRDRFSTEELALIDRLLPWTRSLPHQARTSAPDLFAECLARQHELILKPRAQYGGSGVLAGWETPAGRWRRALESVDACGAVVQERAHTRPEPVLDPATGRTEVWRTVWSLFLTPDGHAGTYARALPADAGAVVGMGADQRACTAGVFTFEAAARPGDMSATGV